MTEPPERSRVDALAVLGAVGSGARMVGFAAFTLLLLLAAVRIWAAGDWLSGTVASLLTLGLALVTLRWFRRLRGDIAQARSPQS